VEEHFYALFPLLLLWLAVTKRPVVRVLLGLCAMALAIRVAYVMFLPVDAEQLRDQIYRSSETRIDSLLFGCLLAVLARGDFVKRYAGVAMLFAGLTLILIAMIFVEFPLFRDTLKFSLQPIGVAVAMAAILYAKPGYIINVVRWVLNSPPAVFIGRISFSAYLTHTAMFHTVRVTLGGDPSWWLLMPAAFVATILVSWLSFRYVEQPMIRIGKQWTIGRRLRPAEG